MKKIFALYPPEREKECTHFFSWSGRMPLTGILRCTMCGCIKEKDGSITIPDHLKARYAMVDPHDPGTIDMFEPDKEPPLTPVCRFCGSSDVMCDAWAGWNSETQLWDTVISTQDHAYCNACDGETKLDYIEQQPQPDIITVTSSNGTLVVDYIGGSVYSTRSTYENDILAGVYLIDLAEWKRHYKTSPPARIDILDLGYWTLVYTNNGPDVVYTPPDSYWRTEIKEKLLKGPNHDA